MQFTGAQIARQALGNKVTLLKSIEIFVEKFTQIFGATILGTRAMCTLNKFYLTVKNLSWVRYGSFAGHGAKVNYAYFLKNIYL